MLLARVLELMTWITGARIRALGGVGRFRDFEGVLEGFEGFVDLSAVGIWGVIRKFRRFWEFLRGLGVMRKFGRF